MYVKTIDIRRWKDIDVEDDVIESTWIMIFKLFGYSVKCVIKQ